MMATSRKKIKIIVTDDRRIFRTGLINGIASCPDVEIIGEAGHGLQLLELLESIQPDLIIMGIQMPVMDGMKALPILKTKYPHIKVMILTMHSDPDIICRMIELGANAYLTKEASMDKIHEAIQALQTRWLYMNDTIRDAINRRKSSERTTTG
jgi:DNA-binding NarL/FixJ family response regulator